MAAKKREKLYRSFLLAFFSHPQLQQARVKIFPYFREDLPFLPIEQSSVDIYNANIRSTEPMGKAFARSGLENSRGRLSDFFLFFFFTFGRSSPLQS